MDGVSVNANKNGGYAILQTGKSDRLEKIQQPTNNIGGKMRTFDHFPEHELCPICKTGEDKECFLLPISGTSDGRICEGQPVHVACMTLDKFRFSKATGVIFLLVE